MRDKRASGREGGETREWARRGRGGGEEDCQATGGEVVAVQSHLMIHLSLFSNCLIVVQQFVELLLFFFYNLFILMGFSSYSKVTVIIFMLHCMCVHASIFCRVYMPMRMFIHQETGRLYMFAVPIPLPTASDPPPPPMRCH